MRVKVIAIFLIMEMSFQFRGSSSFPSPHILTKERWSTYNKILEISIGFRECLLSAKGKEDRGEGKRGRMGEGEHGRLGEI